MRKISKTRTLILSLLFISAINADSLGSIQFRTLKSGSFISQMSLAENEIIKPILEKKSDDNFFCAKDPCCSKIGAVKTYAIKSIVRKRSFDNFDIRGSIKGEGTDKNVSKFLNRPINGILTSSYGYRIHPKRKKKHFHSGIDLAAKSGTPIACAAPGKVVYAGWKNGYGYVVMVDHGKGYETLYAHCSKLAVTIGQSVNVGKTIAYVGRTGVATGPHVHFEVRKNGVYQNPLKYLKN